MQIALREGEREQDLRPRKKIGARGEDEQAPAQETTKVGETDRQRQKLWLQRIERIPERKRRGGHEIFFKFYSTRGQEYIKSCRASIQGLASNFWSDEESQGRLVHRQYHRRRSNVKRGGGGEGASFFFSCCYCHSHSFAHQSGNRYSGFQETSFKGSSCCCTFFQHHLKFYKI